MSTKSRGDTDDLATLSNLEEKSLLEELKARYGKNKIYTYIGDILVAVNPYKDLDLYNKETSERYKGKRRRDNPPHLFAVADSSYQSLITGNTVSGKRNQCIVISGESGAGKTESTKLIIKQLTELCKGKSQLEQQILQVNPLLEAFGNAQTVMNDNSSRFGKYIQLKFHDAKVKGAKISEYLLEKSRVIFQNPKEENFHIFYYMFAGLTDELKEDLGLASPEKYRYLGNGPCKIKTDPNGLLSSYNELINALDLVGFLEEEQEDMFRILAGVLTIGQVEVDTNEKEEAFVRDEDVLKRVADILGLQEHQLKNMLTFATSRASGEFFTRNYSKEQAHNVRDALAKALYGRLFSWIVNKVNQLLAPEEDLSSSSITEIGILDIFGFENLGMNSFEQVCINLANEQLQNFFNQHIFTLEQAEYQLEGVDWTRVPFVNNQPLLELFMAKPISVLALLDEESLFPKGSDHSYVEKMNHNFNKSHHYIKTKVSTSNKFSIDHYAGRVEYDATGFLEKNRDALPLGATQLFKTSNVELISLIFTGTITRTGTLALQNRISQKKRSRKSIKKGRHNPNQNKKLTVGAQFKNSLLVLMELLNQSNPHFVRCLKPNMKKEASSFDDKFVTAQLRYTGMLETTRIRKMGYAFRPKFEDFVSRYGVLTCNPKLSANQHGCKVILERVRMADWMLGKTKVFLKYYHQDKLEDELKALGKKVIQGQKVVRGFLARRRFARILAKYRREKEESHAFLLGLAKKSLQQQQKLLTIHQMDKHLPEKFLKMLESANGEVIHFDANNPPLTPPPSPPPPEPEEEKPSSPTPTPMPRSAPLLLMPEPTSNGANSVEVEETEDKQEEEEGKEDKKEEEEEEEEEEESGSEDEEDEDQEVEIQEDIFVKKKTLRKTFGGAGGKGAASKRWFQETQYNGLKESLPFLNWFHGIITRRQSEKLLADQNSGAFLVRVSESRFGYTVSLKADEKCKHFAVDQLRNKRYVVVGEERAFRNLMELVKHYRANPISPYGDKLKEPVGQEEDECDYDDLLQGLPSPSSSPRSSLVVLDGASATTTTTQATNGDQFCFPPPPPEFGENSYYLDPDVTLSREPSQPPPLPPKMKYQSRQRSNRAAVKGL
ncbi:myosin-IIIb-like isoform X2 [Apostichopus japonicus]|uniref:myosin-IIIb-like isoform X2 n=1 Tax=Stichopus japonicus TaxID=307972 RepID=UPI003AB3F3BE